MSLLEYWKRQFTYNAWANNEVFRAIRNAPEAAMARPLQLLSHIGAAERLWLERLMQQPQSVPVWPEPNIDQCEEQLAHLAQDWQKYLAELSEAAVSEEIHYKNSKGELWHSAAGDVLSHVLLHSAYHRGQIATAMRAEGVAPAYTDFIHAVRQGLIK
jgi:uncharacterized damage-inducible protein DinB